VLVKRAGPPDSRRRQRRTPALSGKTSFHAPRTCSAYTTPTVCGAPLIDGRPGNWKAAVEQLAARSKMRAASTRYCAGDAGGTSPTRQGADCVLGQGLAVFALTSHGSPRPTIRRPGPREHVCEERLPQHRFDNGANYRRRWKPIYRNARDTVSAIAGFSSMRRPASSAGAMNRLYAIEAAWSPDWKQGGCGASPMRPSALARIAFALGACCSPARWTRVTRGTGALRTGPFALDRLPEVKPSRLNSSVPGEGSVRVG